MVAETRKKSRPTALKREIQNEKKRLRNKMYKSRIHTAIRKLEKAIANKEKEAAQEKLKEVFSLMDKGVKKGVVKKNKASRTKARYTAKATSI